ncbi:MAG: RES family NAD+ phosphorylase [Bacteroidota bacterium]
MEVFRITSEKWAGVLQSSGRAARWNSNGVFVTYTGSSRALSCLEMLVHLRGEEIQSQFKLSVIEIPEDISIEKAGIFYNDDWTEFENYYQSQEVGDEWAKSLRSVILRVPSAIIKNEYNFLINPQHSDFKKIKISKIEDFHFDLRLKE